MKCPSDSATLVMSERSGIEIDYCPECRGVWLDRGELDKIIDRAGSAPSAAPQAAPPAPPAAAPAAPAAAPPPAPAYGQQNGYGQQGYDQRGYGQQQPYDPRYDRNQQPYRRKKKENWLSELFD
ncbi:MAG: zf-TFIIB domain-containing protein [Microbacteriaceae bacterium]